MSSPFFRRLLIPYLVLIGLVTAAVGFVGAATITDCYLDRTRSSLHNQCVLAEGLVAPALGAGDVPGLRRLTADIGKRTGSRVTIVAVDGVVLADSEADPDHMENHRSRPEIQAAAVFGEADSTRLSGTIHMELMYLCRKIECGGKTFFLRMAVHLSDLQAQLNGLYRYLGLLALAALLVAAAICLFFARRQAAPLVELTDFARGLARGDLKRRVLGAHKGEMAMLASSLNVMADSLSTLLAQTNKDKAQLLAILSSMSEGLIATDREQRILLANEAAASLLGFSAAAAQGKLLWEVVRCAPVLQAAEQVRAGQEARVFQVGPLSGRYLDVTVRTFPAAPARVEGLIVVTHDTTQAVQYQEMRKEFVANVSHELRTPLSLIKGFAETLRDGALVDPQKGPQYLRTIERHVDQLTNLVHDLLDLAQLESSGGLRHRVSVDMGALARRSTELLMPAAQGKDQSVTVQVAPNVPPVAGDADFLERALGNLIENAIKYTPSGGHIDLRVRAENSTVVVEVQDTGIGIPAEDLPRIFERFYRVDRSRSREMGGTGLGLAIVKHVVQSHGGKIDVASTPGSGSTFVIRLPAIANGRP